MRTVRPLLLLFSIFVTFIVGGDRCIAFPAIDRPLVVHLTPALQAFREGPDLRIVGNRDLSRRPIVAVIFPAMPVPMAYHPQPAHC
ncbi:MAG: hypothetical protein EOP85_09600 [Verrucomicrobiaceae bacterium]|nr:MAG: hypothetical protein EOP85_09600 [Verrucomicrobiaceae bacterium]